MMYVMAMIIWFHLIKEIKKIKRIKVQTDWFVCSVKVVCSALQNPASKIVKGLE
jgi:hypothetical protein